MRQLLLTCFLMTTLFGQAQNYAETFTDKTLRVDYIFSGNAEHQAIYVDELSSLPHWAGRQHHLSKLPLAGNARAVMRDEASGNIIYQTSFSSLFQEWITTDEAKTIERSFENTVLFPYPLHKATVELTLYDMAQKPVASITHTVNPHDILIRQRGMTHITPHKYLLQSGSAANCIDIVILAEGYTAAEMDIFHKDAERACESLFAYEPFKSRKSSFNVVAVESVSEQSGVSIPRLHEWKETAFGSHFSTFYSDRYLTTRQVQNIHNALAGIPYEHIIILANTAEYGGGGIYNAYELTAAHHPMFAPVVVHEFGHSFGGLADEYFYENDTMSDIYPTDIEPWEPNITTLKDFGAKWQDMLPSGTPIPTPVSKAAKYPVGVYEGGGYSFKGVYRPADRCRMRDNMYPTFCPVCQRALLRVIDFYTK
jgi:hypothetical protein